MLKQDFDDDKEAWKPSGSQYEDHVLLCLKLSCKI